MKTKFIYLTIAIFVLLNVYLITRVSVNDSSDLVKPVESLREIEIIKMNLNHYMDMLIRNQVKSNNQMLDSNIMLSRSDDTLLPLYKLTEGKAALLANFSNSTCQVCVADEITLLKKLSEVVGKDRIILIHHFNDRRDRVSFERNNDLLTYELHDQLFPTGELSGQPVLFIVSGDYRIHDLFIPNKDLVNLSESYYEGLVNKYF